MTKYESLTEEARSHGLETIELPLQHTDGMVSGNRIGIRTGQTSTEKACVLAEEIAHADYTVGNILDQGDAWNRKQELLARTKAYDRLIDLSGLIEAFEHGCQSRYEAAAFLEVTEEFLEEAVERYRDKYGCYVRCGAYVIQFEPGIAVTRFV